jgi:hypothetical protein
MTVWCCSVTQVSDISNAFSAGTYVAHQTWCEVLVMRTHPVAAAILAGFVLLSADACAVGSSSVCDRGERSAESAVRGFLGAAAGGDPAAAARYLILGNTVDPDTFTSLTGALSGMKVDDLRMTVDRMGSVRTFTVIDERGQQVGDFDVYEDERQEGCYAVAWGNVPDEPEPEPGVSQSTVPG